MNRIELFRLLYAILVVVFSTQLELTGAIIQPNNPNFQYSGRINFSNTEAPVLYWPGTQITANFEGTILNILLNDQTGQSYYNVVIDKDYAHPHVIDCQPGEQSYVISSTLTDAPHTLLIFRRTEASTGPTSFLGIEIDDGKTLLTPPGKPGRRIEFYGNSITCGMGNEAPDNADDDNMAEENNFLAYGAVASRKLDAEYVCIAKSGIGIMISWFDMIMPEYYYRLNPDDPESHWNFSDYSPDVVVVNLFQNDSWLIQNLNPVPDSTAIINAYKTFILQIREHHPNAYMVCCLGSMDATRAGSPWPGYIEKAVERLRTENDDTNIDTFFFPFENWWKHPRVRHHQQMGEDLAVFIGEKMEWELVDTSTDEKQYNTGLLNNFVLLQNYPNPFNPSTLINYQLPITSEVELSVYTLQGQKVAALVSEQQPAGVYQVEWHAGNLASGIYYYKIMVGQFQQVKKMVLVR